MNIGAHVGQYRIVRKIGAGGMGTVYLAEHVLLGRRAAIKTLLPALSMQREIVDRFFNEARATSAISDPGVVQIFDFGYHVDGAAYIVMELLEGEALADRLDRLHKLPVSEALRIARQVAGSLAAAHACDIVHRDLKPENVFLIRDAEAQGGERTKILDFGICKLGDDHATQTGTMLGTPVYMSPEQCQGAGHVDQRSDLYALGCVLFQMLTGRTPFEGDGAGEYIVAHMREPAPAPTTFAPELPNGLDALIAKCLEKSPQDRFQTMAELQAAIERILAQLSAPGTEKIAVPSALALAPGFKSVYDGNFGTGLRTHDGPGTASRRGVSTLGAANGELLRPRRTGLRAMFAIVFGGVIAGMIAFSVNRHDEADASTGAVPEASVPAPAAAPAAPPVEPPIADVAPTVDTVSAAAAIAKPVETTVRPKLKPTARPKTIRPRARVVERRPTPVAKPPIEDLYETR
ncbi:MAG: serine/threonine-protein kinase [Kofleriaceae bacterium]